MSEETAVETNRGLAFRRAIDRRSHLDEHNMWSTRRSNAPRASSLAGVREERPCIQRHHELGYHCEWRASSECVLV